MLKIRSPAMLGSLVRHVRTAQQIPAADLAAAVGSSAVSLRRIEQGPPTAALAMLFSVLDELGIEMHLSLPPGVPSPAAVPDGKPRRTRVGS